MQKKIIDTESLCPICLKKIKASYIEEDGSIYLEKNCEEHGDFKVLFWRDAKLYKEYLNNSVHDINDENLPKTEKECPFDCGLCKEHEGKTCTAVLEVTYRCNMHCPICFADATKENFEPSLDDIKEMYYTVLKTGNKPSIQISGGEPTVRDDIDEIVKMGKDIGFPHIQVNTNGIRIANEKDYALKLKKAGTDLIYLQFDGLNDEIYLKTRGQKISEIKKRAINNCKEVGLGVLLVVTVAPKINLDTIWDIIEFAKENMPCVRGVHFQPISYFGRFPGNIPLDEDRCSLSDVLTAIEKQSNNELNIHDFSPRKRYDSHCAFSGLFYLNDINSLIPIKNIQNENGKDINFAKKTNEYTNKRWRLPKNTNNSMTKMEQFKNNLQLYTLSISGMGFQDCWNIDIGRLKGCCVHVVSHDNKLIPLCIFHLTSVDGKRVYQNA